jgi:hypothetical protein
VFPSIADINNKIPIKRYFETAKLLYNNANDSFLKKSYSNAYIEFFKFQILVLNKLPAHNDFDSGILLNKEAKKWLNEAKIKALETLEEITIQLDAIEDRKLQIKRELDLIDEFDFIDACTSANNALPKTVENEDNAKCSKSFDLLYKFGTSNNSSENMKNLLSNSYSFVPSITYRPSVVDDEENFSMEDRPLFDHSGITLFDVYIIKHIGDYQRYYPISTYCVKIKY